MLGTDDFLRSGRPWLRSAIDYLTPADKLSGLGPLILEERDHKLEAARARRQQNRAAAQAVA